VEADALGRRALRRFRRLATSGGQKLTRYVVVGSTAALAYLAIAFHLEHQHNFSPAASGVSAYLILAPLTYLGHRRHTFASTNKGFAEPARFAVWALVSLLLAGLIPLTFATAFRGPTWVGNLVVCAIIPILNFLVMNQWVFPTILCSGRDPEK
jgi:putative flippase GtrA